MEITLGASRKYRLERQRVLKETSADIADYLYDRACEAVADWTDAYGNIDEESVLSEIETAADNYIDFWLKLPFKLDTPDRPGLHGKRCRIESKEADPGVNGYYATYTVRLEDGSTFSAHAIELETI